MLARIPVAGKAERRAVKSSSEATLTARNDPTSKGGWFATASHPHDKPLF